MSLVTEAPTESQTEFNLRIWDSVLADESLPGTDHRKLQGKLGFLLRSFLEK